MADTPLGDLTLRTVDTVEEAAEFLRWLSEDRPVLGIDTETTGLEWWTPGFLRLVQFGDARTGWTLSAHRWWGLIETGLRRLAESGAPTVFHNAKFDLHALTAGGLPLPDLRRVNDTRILHHLLRNDANHSLKPISEGVWGPAATAGQALLQEGMRKNRWTWATVPESFAPYGAYAALDAVLTARLFGMMAPDLGDPAPYEREMAVQLLVWRAEQRGLRIDVPYTELLRERWVEEAAGIREELKGYGVENPSAKASVEGALRDDGWSPEEWTATGEPKLDQGVLMELMRKNTGITSEVAKRVLRYKRLVKWVSAYLDTILSKRDAAGLWHPSINTMGATTGRMTAELVQTFPRGPEVRRCIAAEEGHGMWSIDYDAQELRVFAAYSGEAGLIQAIAEGKDMHRYAASMVYGVPYDSISKDDPRRQITKNVQYARIYGAGKSKMAATAGVPEHEIERFLAAYDRQFPSVNAFMEAIEQTALRRMHEEGRAYVTTYGGRKLGIDPDRAYALVNYLVQGSCADLLKMKLVQLDAAGLGDSIQLLVHDEVVLQTPEGPEGDEMAATAEAILYDDEAFAPVPLVVERQGPGASWGDTK